MAVHLRLVRRVGSAQGVDKVVDLLAGHPPRDAGGSSDLFEAGFGREAFGLDLSAPGRDESRGGSGFECGAVPGELAVAAGSSVTLQTRARARWPASVSSFTAAVTAVSSVSARAVARPVPPAVPVTKAVVPRKS
ncbi:hypothetical protein [Streptomyces sp. NBRC 109706]|uniref:hypothetical protein n=1 Tax=Streptomyces sp. NBRC 109706 TaxID=1550035 RepID=UPI000784672C